MKAAAVTELEQRFTNRFSQMAKNLILEKPFEGIGAIAQWLEKLLCQCTKDETVSQDFESAVTENINEILLKGDNYYHQLFQKNGIINEHNADNEVANPFTLAVKKIYETLFLENSSNSGEGLLVYRELRLEIERKFGLLLAGNKSLQAYENWVYLSQKLDNGEYELYRAWIKNIPVESLLAEKEKFSVVKNTELHDLAHLHSFRRTNKADAKNYISHLSKISTKSAVDFINEATRGSDLLMLNEAANFQLQLVLRLPASDFVLFIDSLKYPNLQDHAFFTITDFEKYPEIIKEILNNTNLKTPKEHLLLISLENYYDFICRTVTDLYSLSQSSHYDIDSALTKQLKGEALLIYRKWIDEYISASFNKILNELFAGKGHRESKYFLLLFEWLNSHNKLHLTHPSNEGKALVIDLLNDLFLKRIGKDKAERHFLIENQPVNYEALKKLVTLLDENKEDLVFRDKLNTIYCDFIPADKFSWYATGNVNFEEAINNAYYFSQVLCSYDDAVNKWIELFEKYKPNHEGWAFTFPDYKVYQREAFLLTAGIGMAYYKFTDGKSDAIAILLAVINRFFQQFRSCSKHHSVDYVTPLKFAAITTGKYMPQEAEYFLRIVDSKFDGLKYLLIATAELTH